MGGMVPHDKHEGSLPNASSIRLWLRLLSCTSIAEKRLRRRFADTFNTTLPRFDVLAALDRQEAGLAMSELSRRLLVSNGNVTAIVRQLHAQNLVSVRAAAHDRRSSIVSITPAGRSHFAELAAAHHSWIEAMFEKVPLETREALFTLLGSVKQSLAADDTATAD